jgi:hypothetical protein
LIVEGGSKLRILTAVDPDIGLYRVMRFDFFPPGFEGGPISGHTIAGNSDETAAIGQPLQRLFDMTGTIIGVALPMDAASRR